MNAILQAAIIICAIYIVGVLVVTVILYQRRYKYNNYARKFEGGYKIWHAFKRAIITFPFYTYSEINRQYLQSE
jgi:hypothetical protein